MIDETISRIRRNHGLEHATIHVLTEKHKQFSAQGNSDHRGFSLNVYGDVGEDDVRAAVQEAHTRMKNGEHHLAVHPNCGTVLLTTATMATLSAQAVLSVEQRRQRGAVNPFAILFNALPMAILMVVLSLIVSRPVGLHLQAKYTTQGDLEGLEVVDVQRVAPSFVTRFFHLLLAGGRHEFEPKAYRVRTRG